MSAPSLDLQIKRRLLITGYLRGDFMSTLYTFNLQLLSGEPTSMKAFVDKTLLIVNTASQCGFTPQYEGLQKIYYKYKDKGFCILGFPCNQFGRQEPGDADNIKKKCLINYGVSFPMFEKIEVNGAGAHPLFVYLKEQLPGVLGGKIKWNFTKFLIDSKGCPVKRFAPSTKPESIEPHIIQLIG